MWPYHDDESDWLSEPGEKPAPQGPDESEPGEEFIPC